MAQVSLPTWLRAMMDSRAGSAQGIRWFTPAECAAAAQEPPSEFPGRDFWVSADQQAAANDGWQNTVQVGVGPAIYSDHAVSVQIEFWLDTAQADTLWARLDGQPPFLWFPVGSDEATLVSTLRPYLPADLARPRPHVSPGAYVASLRQAAQGPIPGALPGQNKWVRLMLGLALGGVEKSLAEVENHLLWTRVVDPRFLLMGTTQDNPRSNPAVTVVRTLYSRSTVQLNWFDYLHGTLFGEISYAPAGQAETIKAFNDNFQLNFPLDIPIDVPALLLGLEAINVPALHAHLAKRQLQPDFVRIYIYCLAELSDPDTAPALRPYIAHPEHIVREAIIKLSPPELLREMQAVETDPELRAQIAQKLAR